MILLRRMFAAHRWPSNYSSPAGFSNRKDRKGGKDRKQEIQGGMEGLRDGEMER
jgi:hypothetical protein